MNISPVVDDAVEPDSSWRPRFWGAFLAIRRARRRVPSTRSTAACAFILWKPASASGACCFVKKAIEIRGIEQVQQETMSFFECLKTEASAEWRTYTEHLSLLNRHKPRRGYIARNSAPISTNRPDALTNARMRKSTECTGLRDAITITGGCNAYAGEQIEEQRGKDHALTSPHLTSPHRYGESSSMLFAISRSQRSPLARSFALS